MNLGVIIFNYIVVTKGIKEESSDRHTDDHY